MKRKAPDQGVWSLDEAMSRYSTQYAAQAQKALATAAS